MIETLESRSGELANKLDTCIYIGWILFFIGFTILSLVSVYLAKWEFAIYGILAIVTGISKFSDGYRMQRKYQIIIDCIKVEKIS